MVLLSVLEESSSVCHACRVRGLPSVTGTLLGPGRGVATDCTRKTRGCRSPTVGSGTAPPVHRDSALRDHPPHRVLTVRSRLLPPPGPGSSPQEQPATRTHSSLLPREDWDGPRPLLGDRCPGGGGGASPSSSPSSPRPPPGPGPPRGVAPRTCPRGKDTSRGTVRRSREVGPKARSPSFHVFLPF